MTHIAIRIVSPLVATLIVTASAHADPLDTFGASAQYESFEGLDAGQDPVSVYTQAHVFTLNGPVTFATGVVLENPSSSQFDVVIPDYRLGNSLTSAVGGDIASASDVADGTAFVLANDSDDTRFTLPYDACAVGIAITGFANVSAVVLEAYDANDVLLESRTVTPATVAQWSSNVRGFRDFAGRIRTLRVATSGAILDVLRFSPTGSAVVTVDADASDAPCAFGGQRITVARTCDGVLEPEDSRSVSFACNGAPAINALVDVSDEPIGTNCAAGGVRIAQGLDADRSGVLDSSEITSTRYVCNGVAGADGAPGTNGSDGKDGGCAQTPGASWAALAGLLIALRSLNAERTR